MPLSDFIRNMSQALSKCKSRWIKVDKWDYFKNASQELKNSFCFYEKLKAKLERPHFFKVQSGKITVWSANKVGGSKKVKNMLT